PPPSPPRHLPSFPTRRSSDLPPPPLIQRRLDGEERLVVVATLPAAGHTTVTGHLTFHPSQVIPRQSVHPVLFGVGGGDSGDGMGDRKSTRLNSSHVKISYAVF